MNIRPALESDFAAMWPIFQGVIASATTYTFGPDTSYQDAFAYWFAAGVTSYVGEDNGQVIGMYKVVPNQRDLGSHVANASFMVSTEYSGKGAGRRMGWHCLREAKKAGYQAIQFNFVVSTNERAVRLWRKLGFSIVGTLPKVFRHKSLGYVDAYVMHRFLDDIQA
ncbi:acetyltransferase (plasmid) [Burkholderia sp. KK1]|nr:acetyltransferase [Burkholderia sp. KK1]